jgi:hypothetical protein
MAVTLIATLPAVLVGTGASGDPVDVENDSTAAPEGVANVHVPPAGPAGGFLTIGPIPAATMAALAEGACTVTVTQGAGALTINPTQ